MIHFLHSPRHLGQASALALLLAVPELSLAAPASPFQISVDGVALGKGQAAPARSKLASKPVSRTASKPAGPTTSPRLTATPRRRATPHAHAAGLPLASGPDAALPALSAPTVTVAVDGLNVRPVLAMRRLDAAPSLRRGESLDVEGFWNYPAFVERAELRVTDDAGRLLAAVPVVDGVATWTPDENSPADIAYALRVVAPGGAWDETRPVGLAVIGVDDEIDPLDPVLEVDDLAVHDVQSAPLATRRDQTARRNIAVHGAAVTVRGTARPGASVEVAGAVVPVDAAGAFETTRIVPHGAGTVAVRASDETGEASVETFVDAPETDLFYVALGEATLSRGARGPAKLADAKGEYDETILDGRATFYLKGKVKGRTLVTASADLRSGEIEDLFSNRRDRSARARLERLDPERFYPVYGDRSGVAEDAPSQGPLYVRIERDDSFLLWGDFRSAPEGTDLARLDRGLHGAKAEYNSTASTSFGERRTQVSVHAADPGTLPARDVLRGTGGSVYYLSRRDIQAGSERLRVERRDPVTGLVLEAEELSRADYAIDVLQGRIVLDRPLRSWVRSNGTSAGLVRGRDASRDEIVLVAAYEYEPLATDVDGYTVGGRASHWVNDHLRVGATAQREATDTADQTLVAADATLRVAEGTYIKAEIARTEGPVALARARSANGGLTYAGQTGLAARTDVRAATALRAAAAVDAKALTDGRVDARFTAYFERFEEGFSGTGVVTPYDTTRWGAAADIAITADTTLDLSYAEARFGGRGRERDFGVGVTHSFDERWSASVALTRNDRSVGAAGIGGPDGLTVSRRDGARTDIAVQIDHHASDTLSVYAFGQAGYEDGARDADARAGVGFDWAPSEAIALRGEVSSDVDGDAVVSAEIIGRRDDDSEVSLGYSFAGGVEGEALDTGDGGAVSGEFGALTARARTRYSDVFSVFAEDRIALSRTAPDIAQVYGAELALDTGLTLSGLVELGDVHDTVRGDIERRGVSLTAAWNGGPWQASVTGEARRDRDGLDETLTAWLGRAHLGYDASADWTLTAGADIAMSDGSAGLGDAGYIRADLAAAYRPVAHDRFNALLGYTYLQDLNPGGQTLAGGRVGAGPKQRSHVLSAAGALDIGPYLTLGAKYGVRFGEVALAGDAFASSTAQLGVLRADLHVTGKWDVLLEGRVLDVREAKDRRAGVLAGVYRHVGDNLKVGVGYNFTDFSDDLTDLDRTHEGVFLNVVGKF